MNTKLATSLLALTVVLSPSLASATDIFNQGSANDLIVGKEPAKVSWSGVSIGAGANYSMVNHEFEAEGFSFDGLSSDGFQGCGILGFQKQSGQIVFGAEGRGCHGDVSTELTYGPLEASLDLDYSYAAYGKLGVARGPWLLSALLGYKWQHYELTGNDDDTIGGLSGGLLLETKLDDAGHLNFGLEILYTDFENQDAEIFCEKFKILPSQIEAGARLTYTIPVQ